MAEKTETLQELIYKGSIQILSCLFWYFQALLHFVGKGENIERARKQGGRGGELNTELSRFQG